MPSRPKTHKPMRRLTERHQVPVASDSYREWYTHSGWRKLRARHLKSQPLCVYCESEGRMTLATVVDHIEPHRGDRMKFLDASNLQSLCKPHHDSTKARQERGGRGEGHSSQPLG